MVLFDEARLPDILSGVNTAYDYLSVILSRGRSHDPGKAQNQRLFMDLADERLDDLIRIAEQSGLTLDEVVKAIGRADQSTFEAFSDNPSRLPLYIQSRERP